MAPEGVTLVDKVISSYVSVVDGRSERGDGRQRHGERLGIGMDPDSLTGA